MIKVPWLRVFPQETLNSALKRQMEFLHLSLSETAKLTAYKIAHRHHGGYCPELIRLFSVMLEEQEESLLRHTLYPLLTPFLSEYSFHEYQDKMGSTRIIESFGARAIALKKYICFCPQCIEEQKKQYGACYFKLGWQIKDLSICLKHNCNLWQTEELNNIHNKILNPNLLPLLSTQVLENDRQGKLLAQTVESILTAPEIYYISRNTWVEYFINLAARHHYKLRLAGRLSDRPVLYIKNIAESAEIFWGKTWLMQRKINMIKNVQFALSSNWLRYLIILKAIAPSLELIDAIQDIKSGHM